MSGGPAPLYSSDPIAPRPDDPPEIVADARDLKVLRKAVEDASSVGIGLWVSYLFVLFYLLVAAGSVTHKDLFLETPVRLPFLGVDLPLKGFFVLGPLLFLIVHAYVLLHFAMLSGKVRAFDRELRGQIADDGDIRTRLRRQLPSSIFVQLLAGPKEVRDGPMGGLLWLIAMASLMIGPILLLIFFALQFLPYHNEAITWWQRGAVGVDLWLMWTFWPRIALLDGAPEDLVSATQRMILLQRRVGRGAMWGMTGGSALLLLLFATFPGETLDDALWQPKGFLPRDSGVAYGVKPPAWQEEWPFPETGRWVAHIPGAVRAFLVEGAVQPASRTPESLWSNRLVLPGLDMVVHLKLDSEDKIKFLPETVSLRDRDLRNAVLIGAVLRKADFTGARMGGVRLDGADLRGAKMGCADWLDGARASGRKRRAAICTDLRGASLGYAKLQGTSLETAQLQGATLFGAQLKGASLLGAQLQGAVLDTAELQGAVLVDAQLQGASLRGAHLQGALLVRAQLQGAVLDGAELQGAALVGAELQGASLVRAQLEGASLDGAELQGAWLSFAQLQGASLRGAALQGASLDGAALQGASLDFADLQGASLDFTELQGTSLKSTCVWRANATSAVTRNTWIEPASSSAPIPRDNRGTNTICTWTERTFQDLIALITRTVPDGPFRETALDRIKSRLNPKPGRAPPDEEAMKTHWDKPHTLPSLADHEAEIAKHWHAAGCAARGAPHVAASVARRLDPFARSLEGQIYRLNPTFTATSPEPAKLAAALLSEACEGARGLSDADKAVLVKLRGPVVAAPPAPSFSLWPW